MTGGPNVYSRLAVFAVAAVVLALAAPTAFAAMFTVNAADDAAGGTCDGAHCNLREAITAANSVPGIDTIAFGIGSGSVTIRPTSELPATTDPVVIDGTTQPGFTGAPIVELNGASAGSTAGLRIAGGLSLVRGLVVGGFMSFAGAAGIVLEQNGGNRVEGNYVGTDLGGAMGSSNFNGIDVGSGGNVIGGTAPGARNVVSGNQTGIRIQGAAAQDNRIEGNYIGLDATGKVAVQNNTGIFVQADRNTVGGSSPAARNVVSGNSTGIRIDRNGFAGTTGKANVVVGNYVGTDPTGTLALPNDTAMYVYGSTNRIGGTDPGAGNLVSGNKFGISVVGDENVLEGNLIGTDASGTRALGNINGGVGVQSGPGTAGARNRVGGAAAGARNVIAATSGGYGLALTSASGNLVQGNYIGTDVTGTATLGNDIGVFVHEASTNNTIGGTAPGERNVIAHNRRDGVRVVSGTGTAILANSIHSNRGLGINLGLGSSVAPNDPGDVDTGPNELQNFPVLTSVGAAGAETVVSGTLESQPDRVYRIELFTDQACNPAGFGEGRTVVAAFSVTTDASGTSDFSATTSALAAGAVVTATATDAANNTSGFSACRTVDTTAPKVTISSAPPALTNAASASVAFAADESASFACSLDGAAFAACSSPHTVSGLADGAHAITVRATDAAGNSGSASVSWTVDATPPTTGTPSFSVSPKSISETSVVTAETADAGSGLVGGEYFLANDPGPGNGIQMTLSGSTLSATIATDVAPGVYALGARSRDRAGNWSQASVAYFVVYDPTGGHATGGGWILPASSTSDAGDVLPGLDGTSKANFGFVVKYESGASTVPGGQLVFHYNVGNFRLRSTEYEWLVVTNDNWAKVQGTATVDGATGVHPFRVDARDGDANGGTLPDRFVIRVWAPGADPNTAEPIYKASGDVSGGQVIIKR